MSKQPSARAPMSQVEREAIAAVPVSAHKAIHDRLDAIRHLDTEYPPSEVGRSFTLTVERHASKPLMRLREREESGGKVREKATAWMPSHDFWPELLPANGRLRAFLFGEISYNPPTQQKSG